MAKKKSDKNIIEAEIIGDNISKNLRPEETSRGGRDENKFWLVVGWVVWITFAFFAAQIVLAFMLVPLQATGIININQLGTFASALIEASIYALILLIGVGVPLWRAHKKSMRHTEWRVDYPTTDKNSTAKIQTAQSATEKNLAQKNFWRSARKLVGLNRLPKWDDLAFLLSNIPVFYVLVIFVSLLAQLAFGAQTMTQEQALDFATTGNLWWQLIIIFMALVVVAPVAEEIMMRGFLFTKIRERLGVKIRDEKSARRDQTGFWATSIIVSLLFALAHMQLNVGIMTFILSMFTCRMREKTGAIWAGIGLHMVVNLVAFSLRFIFGVQ